jgi:DNA-binding response OmpR family regulator
VLKDIADVFQACTLEQARQLLLHETFDLILLDLSLPDGSGMELLTLLNVARKQSVPVVVFSAHEVSQEVAHKVAAALVKSRTSNQALIDTIRSLIQRNRSQQSTNP